jgi:hypothetical protein
MSAINGDKARFHRKRKDRIARRARKRQLLASSDHKAVRNSGSGKQGATA